MWSSQVSGVLHVAGVTLHCCCCKYPALLLLPPVGQRLLWGPDSAPLLLHPS